MTATTIALPRRAPAALVPDDTLTRGELAGSYVVERALAAGGCGEVYEARGPGGERVAIKVLHRALADSPIAVQRFLREVIAVRRIGHPSIVEIHEVGALVDGRPFYAMELLEGLTLADWVRTHGRMSAREAGELLGPIVRALAAAHAAGVVHRDLKGSNVFLAEAGGHRHVKVLDFGIAKLTEREDVLRTATGQQLGTPAAMAPEQFLGQPIDARTDVYAVGVLLFEMLTGRLPFLGPTALDFERQHLESPAPRPSTLAPVTPAVEALVLACLEKQPDRRPSTVDAVWSAWQQAAGEHAAPSRPTLVVQLDARPPGALDEEDLWAASDLVEETARALTQRGWQVPLVSGTSLLARHTLAADADASRGERARLITELCTLVPAAARAWTDVTAEDAIEDAAPVLERDGLHVSHTALDGTGLGGDPCDGHVLLRRLSAR